MKAKYYIPVFLMSLLFGFASCSDQEDDPSKAAEGFLRVDLSVNEQNIVATRASDVNVNSFVVQIEKSGEGIVKSYSSYEQLKEEGTLRLEAGQYTVTAHTDATFEEESSFPYYSGSKDFEILPNAFADAKIMCSMLHAKICVIISEELLESITDDYEIGVSNGTVEHTFTTFIDRVSEDWYFAPSGNFKLTIKGKVLESDEEFDIEMDIPKEIKANDFVTVNVGLETKSIRSMGTSIINIKLL